MPRVKTPSDYAKIEQLKQHILALEAHHEGLLYTLAMSKY